MYDTRLDASVTLATSTKPKIPAFKLVFLVCMSEKESYAGKGPENREVFRGGR